MPSTIMDETARHVGEPKFLLPDSENTCALSFHSFVQRTTSHGGDGVSDPPGSNNSWLLSDTLRLCVDRKAGEEGRGELRYGDEMRDWNR